MFDPDLEEDDPHTECESCGEEHPIGVMDGGLCPVCVDWADDDASDDYD